MNMKYEYNKIGDDGVEPSSQAHEACMFAVTLISKISHNYRDVYVNVKCSPMLYINLCFYYFCSNVLSKQVSTSSKVVL